MKRMIYSEAINLLVEFLKKEYPDFSKHPDFMAVVTHFLQNPKICPPFMSKDIYEDLRGLSLSYMRGIPTSSNQWNVGS